MGTSEHVVIMGAGQAAAQTIIFLSKSDFSGQITLIGDEGCLPYQRPPLSKAYLKGEMKQGRLFFRPENFYDDLCVSHYLSDPVVSIDRSAHRVTTLNGLSINYDKLILATGSRPRRLPHVETYPENMCDLRQMADSDILRCELSKVRHLTLIGGGYIGLEVAAVARQMDLDVTILERDERLLARVTSPVVSAFYKTLHESHGSIVKLGCSVSKLSLTNNRISALKLTDNTEFNTDLVLVGIGAVANEGIASKAGVDCDDGILVSSSCQTSDPHIYAAGDCARRQTENGPSLRLESVHNAIEQGDIIAAHITGRRLPSLDTPWFWSDQFNIKLQTAGLLSGYDMLIETGDKDAEKFSVFYFRNDYLIAVDAINDAPSFLVTKQLLKSGQGVPIVEFQVDALNIKDIAKKYKKV